MNQNPRSSSNPDKQICVHPILFAVYPILFIYNSNFAFVDAGELIRPLAILVALTGVCWRLTRRFGKDAEKGPLLLSIGLLILFSYGPASNALLRKNFRLSAESMTIEEMILVGVYFGLILERCPWSAPSNGWPAGPT